MADLTPEERAWLRDAPPLRFGVDCLTGIPDTDRKLVRLVRAVNALPALLTALDAAETRARDAYRRGQERMREAAVALLTNTAAIPASSDPADTADVQWRFC